MKDKEVLNLPMHRANASAVFFIIFTCPCMEEGLMQDLKFRRVMHAFHKTIKIKKSKNPDSRLGNFFTPKISLNFSLFLSLKTTTKKHPKGKCDS